MPAGVGQAKPGARDSIQVSCVRDRNPTTGVLPFEVCITWKIEPRTVRSGHSNGHFHHYAKCLSLPYYPLKSKTCSDDLSFIADVGDVLSSFTYFFVVMCTHTLTSWPTVFSVLVTALFMMTEGLSN